MLFDALDSFGRAVNTGQMLTPAIKKAQIPIPFIKKSIDAVSFSRRVSIYITLID
jgi:hypothetical protein